MNRQIFVSGPSGSGKTTLARHISREYNLPFISGSTKNLWEAEGITSHSQIIRRSIQEPEWGLEFQQQVLLYREIALRGLENFVTDRSPLDNMLYFLLQNSPWLMSKQTDRYLSLCKKQYGYYIFAKLIYLEPHAENLEDDDMRINNYYYQKMTDMVMQGIMNQGWLGEVDGIVLKDWDWDIRLDAVDNFLFNKKPKSKQLCGRVRRKLRL